MVPNAGDEQQIDETTPWRYQDAVSRGGQNTTLSDELRLGHRKKIRLPWEVNEVEVITRPQLCCGHPTSTGDGDAVAYDG